MKLMQLNRLKVNDAYALLERCCVAPRWIEGMLDSRPFESHEAMFSAADELWQRLEEVDYLSAFQGHPQIGDVSTLRKKFAATTAKASHEQSGMNKATESVLQTMMALNKAYLEKFGFIFIVCATGKSAEQMLELIEQRISNSRENELIIAAKEQAKITQLRLKNLL